MIYGLRRKMNTGTAGSYLHFAGTFINISQPAVKCPQRKSDVLLQSCGFRSLQSLVSEYFSTSSNAVRDWDLEDFREKPDIVAKCHLQP